MKTDSSKKVFESFGKDAKLQVMSNHAYFNMGINDVSPLFLIEAIRKAQQEWKRWEWDQPVAICQCGSKPGVVFGNGEYADWDDRFEFLVNEGHASFCASEVVTSEQGFSRIVRREAARASQLGDEAIAAIEQRRFQTALNCIQEAAAIENDHGEAVTWGPVFHLACCLEKSKAFVAEPLLVTIMP